MIRTPEALIPYVLAIACVLAGYVWHLGDSVGGLGRTITLGQAEIGGPFQLVDQNGEARSDRDFRGRYMLVYFGYTHCPDVCPLTLEEMADALDKLGKPKSVRIVPVFITVDPARDTPKVMKAYLAPFGDAFVGLSGDAKAVMAAERAYRVYARRHALPGGDYAMDHSSTMYLMGPDGRFVTTYEEVDGPDKIAADLRARL